MTNFDSFILIRQPDEEEMKLSTNMWSISVVQYVQQCICPVILPNTYGNCVRDYLRIEQKMLT